MAIMCGNDANLLPALDALHVLVCRVINNYETHTDHLKAVNATTHPSQAR
jgi:hypothetical protein